MATAEKNSSTAQNRLVFQDIRDRILRGETLPGAKLNIALLAESLGVSAGAVREALAMLEAEALVSSEPSRGYRVSPVSTRDLTDLVSARIDIEKLCIAESIRHGDLRWEGGVVASFHRLSRMSERDAADQQRLSREWTEAHADFHHALVAGCPNQWLLRMHTMLYTQSERYRQLSAPVGNAYRDVGKEHQDLVDALLSHDVAAAQELVAAHLHETATVILDALRLSEPRPA